MKTTPRVLGFLMFVLAWWTPVEAACTGSGLAWNCSAGSSASEVQSAINNATNAATITFAAGTYNWSGIVQLPGSKGVTLICATVGACIVPGGGTKIGMPQILGTQDNLYRISGFTFQNSSEFVIWFGYANPANGILNKVRVDHNTFTGMTNEAVAVMFGDTTGASLSYGVVDHNTVNCPGSCTLLMMLGKINPNPPPSAFGTANNMFAEDNTITIATMTNTGTGCSDSWGGATIVWRRNTSVNCPVDTHGTAHAGGPANWELYENSITMNNNADPIFRNCYRCFHHQGSGEFIAFKNRFTASSGKAADAMVMQHYRSYGSSAGTGVRMCDGTSTTAPHLDGNREPTTTHRGYPCWRQPGRDFAGNLKPIYAWNNYWTDTLGPVALDADQFNGFSPDYFANHFQANRDYYNAVSASEQSGPSSPFNGTSGMGFGTLARRPTTCTTGTETGGGVAYFATDQSAQGTLYRCSATNTWTEHYTPYTYPHPLTSGLAVPSAPTNLRIIK